jgi:hypothetical protein
MGTPDDDADDDDDDPDDPDDDDDDDDDDADDDDADDADDADDDPFELEDEFVDELDELDPDVSGSVLGSAVVSSKQPAMIVALTMIGNTRVKIRGIMRPLVQGGCGVG